MSEVGAAKIFAAGHGLADTHIQSTFSDGVSGILDILDYVEERGDLSVVSITDHNTIKGAVLAAALSDRYSFDIVVGEEIMSRDGEIIGLFLHEEIEPDLSAAETVSRIHRQGGLAIAPHLFVIPTGSIGGRGLWRRGFNQDLDGIEISGSPPFGYSNLLTKVLYRNYKSARVGGSDAHVMAAIGATATSFEGRGALDFRRAVEERRTRPVKLKGTMSQFGVYWGNTLDILKRHRTIMSRHSPGEVIEEAEAAFWDDIRRSNPTHYSHNRDRILRNCAKIARKAA
ncbi:MAG: PHP-associated domain-containing protein [Candidatus Aquicultorales bacterium]